MGSAAEASVTRTASGGVLVASPTGFIEVSDGRVVIDVGEVGRCELTADTIRITRKRSKP
jgi:hypothetical protein